LILLIFRSEIGDNDIQLIREFINTIRQNESIINTDSRPQRLPFNRNREPRFLGTGQYIIDNGRLTDPTDPTRYVLRDEFIREMGRIEGKIEQYRIEQSNELRDGFDRVGTQFQSIENTVRTQIDTVQNLIAAVTKEVDDVQNVKEDIGKIKNRLNNIDDQLLKVDEIRPLKEKIDEIFEILKELEKK
jgi:hypothetical protein